MQQQVYGQEYTNMFFKEYTGTDELPSLSCSSLYKDRYGFLWIGNAYGISIYNGRDFIRLSLYNDDKNFYLGDSPQNFLQLDSNRLLITCTNGFFVFHYKTKTVEKININLKKAPEERIEIIGFNKAHDRIIVKTGNAIYFFDLLLHQQGKINCINANDDVFVRNEFTGNICFYYTKNAHLVSVNTDNGSMDSLLLLPDEKSVIVNGQCADKYIIATTKNVLQFNTVTKEVITTTSLPSQVPGIPFFPRTVKQDEHGNFWIGGETNLFVYNPLSDSLNIIDGSVSNFSARKINTFMISDIWIDSESLFVSSYSGGGLFEYRRSFNIFRDFYLPAVINASTYSMIIRDGYILGANDVNGIYKFPLAKNDPSYTYYPLSKNDGSILQLEELDHDNFWVLFNENFKIGIAGIKDVSLKNDVLPINIITKRYFDSINNFRLLNRDYRPVIKKINDSLFYISVGRSLYSVTGDMEFGFQFDYIDSIKSSGAISCISGGSSFILGTTKGELFILENSRLIKKTGALNNFFLPAKAIDTDSRGNIYLMTVNGLYIFDAHFGLIKTMLKPFAALLDDKIFAGRMDKNDVLWMSTLGGVTAYNTITGRLINYASDGLMRNSHFITKAVASDEGHIYFGGSEGITEINTKQAVEADTVRSILYFDEIDNGNKVLYSGLIPGSMEEKKSFRYNDNSFNFSFRSISYQQADGIYYKYKLEGFDTAWKFANKEKKLNFLSLAPGKYKFVLKEMYPDNRESAEIFYSFAISQPFWETPAFIILSVILMLLFLVLIINYVIRHKLEAEKVNTSRQIALKNERERISQDLHDDLGSGLTSIRLLTKAVIAKNGKGNTENMLDNISKISGELIDQMSEIIWLLNNMEDTINGLMAHLRRYMAEYLQRTQSDVKLEFSSHSAKQYDITSVQRRNILMVVKEVFHNVLKHSKATTFSVECRVSDISWIIIMKDNGIGLPERPSLNGNGFGNMKKRIAAINGNIIFKTGNGTTIIIEIPKEKTLL